jgi:hypothetical protein
MLCVHTGCWPHLVTLVLAGVCALNDIRHPHVLVFDSMHSNLQVLMLIQARVMAPRIQLCLHMYRLAGLLRSHMRT